MLRLQNISLRVPGEEEDRVLLSEISARIGKGQFIAILGPSGSGKSMLLKAIAGIREIADGSIYWHDRDLAEEEDLAPQEIGYVPQFSIAYDVLTVGESIESAIRLRVGGLSRAEREERCQSVLRQVGMYDIADRQVKILSGGQKRRLALALEMVCSPALLLCDEVTSGLDLKAEDEIVQLLRDLSQDHDRIVISVTHSLRHLDLYDSIVVLHQGHLAYHGPPTLLPHYFSIPGPEALFPRLAQREPESWHRSWLKHQAAYYAADRDEDQPVSSAEDEAPTISEPEPPEEAETPPAPLAPLPNPVQQFFVLLDRRWKIFLRDRSQLALQLALMFGFPFLVVIFAWDGLPQIQKLSLEPQTNIVEQLAERTTHALQSFKVGSLVSGVVMFQVILLTLMGSNNAAREIAGERLIFEKEKFAGVRPASYIASKAVFLSLLVAAQSLWMGVFVNAICRLPGTLSDQLVFLLLANAAMTAICLGISSLMRSPEQASLASVYLVGFQLPLSGAVLALPPMIGTLTQPFIASYWSWSGFLQTMNSTSFYDAVRNITQTHLSAETLCIWVLLSHVLLGLYLAYAGCKSARWE